MTNLTNPTIDLTFLGNDLEPGHATAQTITSAQIVRFSIQFSQNLINNLKSSSNQVRLQLHRNCPATEDIIATEGNIKAVLKDNGAPVFTGYLSTNFSWSLTKSGEQALSITLEDVGTRLLEKEFIPSGSAYLTGTASSVINQICSACGISVAPGGTTLSQEVSCVVEGGNTCKTLLTSLLYECNAVYYFNEFGQLCIHPVAVSTTGADTLDSSALYASGTALTVNKKLRQYRSARVSFTELGTADNYLIYRNTTGKDSTHPYCKLDIPGGNYFDGTEIYTAQQWSEAQADTFREPAIIEAVNAASESEKVGSGEILAISNLRGVSTFVGSFSVNFTAKGGNGFSMEVHNTSSVAGYLTRLDLLASIVYAKATSIIRTNADGAEGAVIDEEMSWIHDRTNATKHANLVSQWNRNSGSTYSFRAKEEVELGKVYRLNDDIFTGLDVLVIPVSRSWTDGSEIATYSAVGVSTFNLDKEAYYGRTEEGKESTEGGAGGGGVTIEYALGPDPDNPPAELDGTVNWNSNGVYWNGNRAILFNNPWSTESPTPERGQYLWIRTR